MTAPDGEAVRIGGRYRIGERIGAGAMGVVWLATDELLGRTVAVKELVAVTPNASAEDVEEARQRILREGRIGARLQHPHVISMFDVVIHDDRPWLVMEYLPSGSLAATVRRRGPLPPEEVADVGRQVADALVAAHQAGIVHRDVKPGNVLLAADGRVKLTDFGVSRAVDDVQLTRTGLIAGTPAFLPPEVAQGKDPTAASDMYALGATLYAAVEGVPPFGLDDNAYALLHKVATGQPTQPRLAGPLTPVLMRLLATDPQARPSAEQARDVLAAIAAGRADVGEPRLLASLSGPDAGMAAPGTRVDLRRPGRARRRRAPVIGGVLVGLLVLGGGATAVALTGNSTARAIAVPTAGPSATAGPSPTITADPPAAAPSVTVVPSVTPTATAAPAAAVIAPSSTSPAAAAVDPVSFVQKYYGLLPSNVDVAFSLLGPQAQSQSGGSAGYFGFWDTIASVGLEGVRQTGDGTVTATVRFVGKDGTTTNEPYRFVVGAGDDGRVVMQTFSRV